MKKRHPKYTELEIYDDGRIYCHKRERFVNQFITGGYNGIKASGEHNYVHRLVCEAFYGLNDDYQVDHLDGDKFNNNLSNLEFVTRSENIKRAWAMGLMKKGNWKFTDEKRSRMLALWNTGRYTKSHLANLFGVSAQHIARVIDEQKIGALRSK